MGCSLHDGQFAPSSCLRRRAGQFDRGVPINREGYFFVPLWTDFQPGPGPGILDWFTVLLALTSVSILAFHGRKLPSDEGGRCLYERVLLTGSVMGWVSAGCTMLTMTAVPFVQPSLRLNFAGHPMEYLVPLSGVFALGYSLFLCNDSAIPPS